MGMLSRNLPALRVLRSVLYLVNLNSAGLALMGCLAVGACERWGLRFALDSSIVVFGITFSVTFTITQAYQRRERALTTIADLKASLIAMYWHHRDWAQGPGYPEATVGNDNTPWAREVAAVILEFLDNLQRYIVTDEGYESVAEMRLAAKRNSTAQLMMGNTSLAHESLGLSFISRVQVIGGSLPGHPFLMRAYSALSKLSVMDEYLTHKAGYLRGGEGGMSRTAQYLRYAVAQMEQLRMIKIYRTPVMLRHACVLLVYALTVLLAPYFLHVGRCDEGFPGGVCPAPYIMSCLWVVVTSLLLNVQASGEHPLDMRGIDDVFLELSDELSDVLANAPVPSPVADDGSCFAAWRAAFAARAAAEAAAGVNGVGGGSR